MNRPAINHSTVLLEQILATLQSIDRKLDRTAVPLPTNPIADLLAAIIQHRGEASIFSSNELCGVAAHDDNLRDAIIAAVGEINPRRLGKLFGRIEGEHHRGSAVARRGKTAAACRGCCGCGVTDSAVSQFRQHGAADTGRLHSGACLDANAVFATAPETRTCHRVSEWRLSGCEFELLMPRNGRPPP